MPSRSSPPRVRAGLLVALLVLSTMALMPVSVATDHNSNIPPGEVHNLTDNVDIWDRSVLSTRADASTADTTLPNAQIFIKPKNESELNFNYDPIPVFTKSGANPTNITLEMRERTEVDPPENTNVTLIAARLTANFTAFRNAFGEIPNDDLNASAEFTFEGVNETDSTGAVTFTHQPSKSGEYVYIISTNETGAAGLVAVNGNLTVDGNATIVGIEQAMVQDKRSQVTAPGSVVRGNNATFEVNSTLGAGLTNHSVLIYDKEKFPNQEFTLNLTANFTLDYDFENNSTIEHTMDEVVGISRLEAEGEILGFSFSPSSHSGRTSVGFLLDELANETSFPRIPNESTGDAVVHASVTAIEGNQSDSVSVGTFSNFSTGTYQWVHVATHANSSRTVSTRSGTFSIEAAAPTDGDGAGAGPGGGAGVAPPPPPPPPGVSVVNASLVEEQIAPGDSATIEAFVENERQSDATFEARLYVDNEEVASQRVTVPAEETIKITFTRQFNDPGTFDIRVNDKSAGALRVVEPTPTATVTATPTATPMATPTATPTEKPPGDNLLQTIILVGVVLAALLILAGAAYLYLREFRGQ